MSTDRDFPSGEDPTDVGGPARATRLTRRSLIGGALAVGAGVTAFGDLGERSATAALRLSAALAVPPLNQTFPPGFQPRNPITYRVIRDPAIVWAVDGDALVMAIKDELLVRASMVAPLRARLHALGAVPVASMKGPIPPGGLSLPDSSDIPRPTAAQLSVLEDTQLWVLTNPAQNSIEIARTLNTTVNPATLPPVPTRAGGNLTPTPPAVSPNHVFTPASFDSCPGGPQLPNPTLAPFVPQLQPVMGRSPAWIRTVVIDSGYISGSNADSDHQTLTGRVNPVQGHWFDSTTRQWTVSPPDTLVPVPQPMNVPPPLPRTRPAHVLDGVAGHGTFIAGLIAHRCAFTRITVVGERRAIISLPGQPTAPARTAVYSDEFSVALTLMRNANAHVVSCGFAFPTLDSRSSIPFSLVMGALSHVPRPAAAAVVSPAGNENSAREYWPAAHPDVIGVGATNTTESQRAVFGPSSGSNWGSWVKCAARGQDVASLYLDWRGFVEDQSPTSTRQLVFEGWANWSGTSFAAPKVAAAIADGLAANPMFAPLDAYQNVLATQHANPAKLFAVVPAVPGVSPAVRAGVTNLLLG
jgi:hypothetical protein